MTPKRGMSLSKSLYKGKIYYCLKRNLEWTLSLYLYFMSVIDMSGLRPLQKYKKLEPKSLLSPPSSWEPSEKKNKFCPSGKNSPAVPLISNTRERNVPAVYSYTFYLYIGIVPLLQSLEQWLCFYLFYAYLRRTVICFLQILIV